MAEGREAKNDTTNRIINAAKLIFADVGFEGARIDEIAAKAGVNKATIYYQIGDKKELYAEVIHSVIHGTGEKIAEKIKTIKSPVDKLKAYILTIAETVDENPQMPPIMMREIAAGGNNFNDTIAADFLEIIAIITSILEEGCKKGFFVKTIPFVLHMMIMGGIAFFKSSSALRLCHPMAPRFLKNIGCDVRGDASNEIVKLVLKAVMK